MKTIKNYAGLEYVIVTTTGKSIPVNLLLKIEQDIAKKIIQHRPLRGKEVSFLRRQLSLSCAKLSVKLNGNFDASTISRWEKDPEKRLSPQNEMYMRVFFAEQFKLSLKAKNDSLIPQETKEILKLSA